MEEEEEEEENMSASRSILVIRSTWVLSSAQSKDIE
jgi:hypothetical protein